MSPGSSLHSTNDTVSITLFLGPSIFRSSVVGMKPSQTITMQLESNCGWIIKIALKCNIVFIYKILYLFKIYPARLLNIERSFVGSTHAKKMRTSWIKSILDMGILKLYNYVLRYKGILQGVHKKWFFSKSLRKGLLFWDQKMPKGQFDAKWNLVFRQVPWYMIFDISYPKPLKATRNQNFLFIYLK